MARSKEINGVANTLERLMGHSRDRSLLTKYVSEGIFDSHLERSPGKIIFKRSKQCDNLIRNVLALDVVFGSQKKVSEIVTNDRAAADWPGELKKRRQDFEERFKAYGYWLSRLTSLEKELDSTDLEETLLEDALVPEAGSHALAPTSPYALRAVHLLETIEEDGRSSKPSEDRQVEKAWALYRLGLHQQSRELCESINEENPACSEAWLLMVIDAQREKREAERDWGLYAREREFADAMSSHERWADEMKDDAIGRIENAHQRERDILFPALLHWPLDEDRYRRVYRYSDSREEVRNACISILFNLLMPFNSFSINVSIQKAHAMNGLEPEYLLKNSFREWPFCEAGDGNPHSLSETQLQVAQLLCKEYDNSDIFFRGFRSGYKELELKLLHIRFCLGISGYDEARKNWLRLLEHLNYDDLRYLMHHPSLYNAFITHLAQEGQSTLNGYLKSISEQCARELRENQEHIHLNFLRKAYDHSFTRERYIDAMALAEQGYESASALDGPAPMDMCGDPGNIDTNSLQAKFWKYLALRAAVEIPITSETYEELKNCLLSVPNPENFFSDESEYMVHFYYQDEFTDDWYETPYGENILLNGKLEKAIGEITKTF